MPAHHLRVDWVVLDVGETLIDETRIWSSWADWLGVPRLTLLAVLGAYIERGAPYASVLGHFRPGIDIAAEMAAQRRLGMLPPPERWFEESDLYPDVRPSLAALLEGGRRLGIAANQPAEAGVALHHLRLPVEFTLISESIRRHKPDDAFFAAVVEATGTEPGRIAYVGDRVDNDVVPSTRAGMIPVHLRRGPWGHLQAEQPAAAEARVRIDSLSELATALDALEGRPAATTAAGTGQPS
ncbi:MAG: hypothetical protein NVS3B18_00670 [Candidatus Dormibacteria bacterium]